MTDIYLDNGWYNAVHMSRSVKYTVGYKQELSYRQQIARKLRTRYAEGIYGHKYYTVTLKSTLSVTQSLETEPLDRSYTT